MESIEKFIKTVALGAGERLVKGFQKERFRVGDRTGPKEASHEYDHIIDRFIIRNITKAYPQHDILTEESGMIKRGAKSDWLWIVDSLDGTGNFSNGNPLFAVCIALMYKDELNVGVVYAPAIDELYVAKRGSGAYLNNKRIHVSDVTSIDSSYAVYCEGGITNRQKAKRLLNRVYPNVKDVRKLGCAGIETGWVAAGKIDFYLTPWIEPWDVAAGVLLVQEAGGKVTDMKGSVWKPERSSFVCSNRKIHNNVLAML